MPAIVSQTREQLAVSVGYNLHAVELHTATAQGSTTTWLDAELRSDNDYINGYWWRGTSGSNDGLIRSVNDYVGSTVTGTIRGDAITQTEDGDTYELWKPEYSPTTIYDFMNRAIRMVAKEAAPWKEDLSLHTYRGRKVFDAPSGVTGIGGIYYRASHKWTSIHAANTVWAELTDAEVTASADTKDYVEGNASNKFKITGSAQAADILASDDITSLDLSGYDYIEFWFKTTVTTTAGQVQLRLSKLANAAATTENLALPAATAGEWTFCRVALANPWEDTAIISVGLIYTTDIGAATYWVDDIRAVVDDSAEWLPVHRDFWWLGRDRRTIHFNSPPQ